MVKLQTGRALVMPWLKVDDSQHRNPKVMEAWTTEPGAMGLWVMAASWAADEMTDGRVPKSLVKMLRAEELAGVLVECGLWIEDGDGWAISGFLEHNPTKAHTMAERERKRRAGSKGGKATARKRKGSKDAAGATAGATAEPQHSSSPNPNPNPNPERESEDSLSCSSAGVDLAFPAPAKRPGVSAKEARTRKRLGMDSELPAPDRVDVIDGDVPPWGTDR